MIKYQGISTLEVLEDAKNYNTWIASQIAEHVSAPTLEIGAGIGNLSKHFLKSKPLYLTDIDAGLVLQLKKRFKKEKNVHAEQLDISQKPLKKYKSFFGSVYAVNVLEHIKDDTKALKNIHTILQKNGTLLLLVPAKKKVYTNVDKQLGHYRRYEKKELIDRLEKAHFKVDTIYFFNIIGLISWYINGKINKRQGSLKSSQVRLFDRIVPVLSFIEIYIKFPLGISLIVIARKI